jgi:hypothetical protein
MRVAPYNTAIFLQICFSPFLKSTKRKILKNSHQGLELPYQGLELPKIAKNPYPSTLYEF